jgi:uncharacterized glyoxalase superfamily protein PhnB
MSKVDPIPQGYHTVTPYLVTGDVGALLEFVQKAFDAKVTEKLEMPGGPIMHAAVLIGDSHVMMGQASENNPAMPTMLYLYVQDCDAAYQKALDAGAESVQEPTDQFYGDRSGGVRDSLGNQWWVGTHIEDVSPEEIAKRAAGAQG